MSFTQQGFPKKSAPFVDIKSGIINQTWYQLLIALWVRTGGGKGGEPDPIAPVVITSSPFIYTASAKGNLWISQGTYCNFSLLRQGTTLSFGKVTRGIFPVSEGDTVTITYNDLPPTIYFVPS